MSNEQYKENKEIETPELNEQDLEDVTGGVGRFSGAFNNARFTAANEYKANGIGAAFKSIGPAAKDGWKIGGGLSKLADKMATNRWRKETINEVNNSSK